VAEWHSAHNRNRAHNLSVNYRGLLHQCGWRDHRPERGNIRDYHLCQFWMDKCGVLHGEREYNAGNQRLQQRTKQDGGDIHVPVTDWRFVLSLRWELSDIMVVACTGN
jgi:hypothetical protein